MRRSGRSTASRSNAWCGARSKRAGVESRHKGAHVLRHSAATSMLRHGVSLAGVGTVLRHRSPAMTAHYAKVDMTLLATIAQPWPGSCVMLIDDAHRYVALRRSLGFKLEKTARHLDAFTRHAMANGDSHIRTATALAWTAAVSSTPGSRYRRLQEIADFARFLHAEDLEARDTAASSVLSSALATRAVYLHARRTGADARRRRKSAASEAEPAQAARPRDADRTARSDRPARLRSAEPAARRSAAGRRAAHPSDQVQQEQARADARKRGRGARRLSAHPGDGRGCGRSCVPDGRRQTDGRQDRHMQPSM